MDEQMLAISGVFIFVGIILYFKFKKQQSLKKLEEKSNTTIIIK